MTIRNYRVACQEAIPQAGDPPEIVADATALQSDLGWKPELSALDQIVKDAFRWHRDHPHGYLGG